MIPTTYNLPDAYRGDTYGPIAFYFTDVSGSGIILDGGSGLCQARQKGTKCLGIEWSSSNSGITISGNSLTLNAISGDAMKINPCSYDYDLQVNLSGVTKTYLKGQLTVYPDVSYK